MRSLLLVIFLVQTLSAQTSVTDEIVAFWVEAERQVSEGDFVAYAASFHKEAILVNGINSSSIPIQTALNGWKQGFEDTKNGHMSASVHFTFSEWALGETTAHLTGIFLYTWGMLNEPSQEAYIHFEALLTRSNEKWQILMEYQKALATKEEWEKLQPIQEAIIDRP
jgi:hypothetical protein